MGAIVLIRSYSFKKSLRGIWRSGDPLRPSSKPQTDSFTTTIMKLTSTPSRRPAKSSHTQAVLLHTTPKGSAWYFPQLIRGMELSIMLISAKRPFNTIPCPRSRGEMAWVASSTSCQLTQVGRYSGFHFDRPFPTEQSSKLLFTFWSYNCLRFDRPFPIGYSHKSLFTF